MVRLALGAVAVFSAVPSPSWAETYAFQFVCIDGGHQAVTPWMDERLSNAVSFAKGREGMEYYWAREDCFEYGIRSCPGYTTDHYNPRYPWVEHRTYLSCDEVCINLEDIDGVLYHSPDPRYDPANEVVIRRFAVDFSNSYDDMHIQSTKSTWDLHDAERTLISGPNGWSKGVSYCWRIWEDTYWVTLHADQTFGRVTEVTFVDHEDVIHHFRAVPAYGLSEYEDFFWWAFW